MTTQSNRTRSRPLVVGIVAWISLGVIASCSSNDQATAGGHVEHPVEPVPDAAPSPMKTPLPPSSVAPPEASAVATSAPSMELSASDRFEKRTGMTLSPLEKAIMDDCPTRAWSKNVPKRRCMKDKDCGDGFCDRGRCAAIWTCYQGYGQRCESDDHCFVRGCVDGRCRSCALDAECVKQNRDKDAKCRPDAEIPGARECSSNLASIMPQAVGAPTKGESDAGP